MVKRLWWGCAATFGLAAVLAVSACAGQVGGSAVPIDPDDIGGVVRSSTGPEAGVSGRRSSRSRSGPSRSP